jgi:hypothetical protein
MKLAQQFMLLVQHRFCKFVAAGLRGCVGRNDEGA